MIKPRIFFIIKIEQTSASNYHLKIQTTASVFQLLLNMLSLI